MSNFDRAVKALNDVDVLYGALVSNEDYATVLQGRGLLAPDLPEPAQALAEETWEYQVQTRSQRMPTWLAITDDTLQKWYPEGKYNDLIHTGRIIRGGAGFEIRVLRRRVSPVEVINE